MSESTKRGIKLIGVGLLVFVVATALTSTGNDGAEVVASMLGVVAFALLLAGLVLAVVGIVRKK